MIVPERDQVARQRRNRFPRLALQKRAVILQIFRVGERRFQHRPLERAGTGKPVFVRPRKVQRMNGVQRAPGGQKQGKRFRQAPDKRLAVRAQLAPRLIHHAVLLTVRTRFVRLVQTLKISLAVSGDEMRVSHRAQAADYLFAEGHVKDIVAQKHIFPRARRPRVR